ncbi:MAG: ester cyclase [Solirubrobacteraceae bacterium]
MARGDITTSIERLFELWNAHDTAAMPELYAPGATIRDATNPDAPARGPEAIVARARMILGGFSDAKLERLSTTVDGERAFIEWRFMGTHDGEFLRVPATGVSTENIGMSVVQFDSDGRATSETAYWDAMRFLRETGVLPSAIAGALGS